jgi:hypothetical protein
MPKKRTKSNGSKSKANASKQLRRKSAADNELVGKAKRNAGSGPTEPSRQTIKRLFAVSSNRCAFPNCTTPVIDPTSGSILGEVCHIKGDRPDSKRHDPKQRPSDRQGFANLVILCGTHHKIIDDDEVTYTVHRLVEMKRLHEAKDQPVPPITDTQLDRLVNSVHHNVVHGGSVIQGNLATGGQFAHVINNYPEPLADDSIAVIQGKLGMGGSLELIEQIGCPGLVLTVTCLSKRPAKIHKAILLAKGKGFVKQLEKGFGASLGHNPPKGHEEETLYAELIPLSKPHSENGYILNQDDICRFYLPLRFPGIEGVLPLPPENVSIAVEFFDESERILITGEEVMAQLKGAMEAYKNMKCEPKVRMTMGLRVTSTSLPDLSNIVGKTNPNAFSFGPQPRPGKRQELDVEVGVVQSPLTKEATIGVRITNKDKRALEALQVFFVHDRRAMEFVSDGEGPLAQGAQRKFTAQFAFMPVLAHLVSSAPVESYELLMKDGQHLIGGVKGEMIRDVVIQISKTLPA